MSRLYNITAFPNILNPYKQFKRCYSWTNLCRFLGADRKPVEKLQQGCWSPAVFDGKRAAENVVSLSCIVIDIDHDVEFYSVGAVMILHRMQAYTHTSVSHNPFNEDRFRLVMPLSENAPSEEWRYYHMAVKKWWDMIFRGPKFDESAKDASRAYFVGYRTKWYKENHFDGKILDWKGRAQDAKRDYLAERRRIEAEREQRLEELRKKEQQLGQNRSYTDNRRMKYQQLSECPIERRKLAVFLGSTMKHGDAGERATGWTCPQCNRNDCTFFFIDPIRKDNNQSSSLAYCMHRSSCGFRKSLGYLAEINGYL